MGLNNAMFAGVRVIELAQFVFVPAAGVVLADLGAEVIKIEALSGDPYRTLRIADGRQTQSANLAMEQNNRGKKSLALDLKRAEGRELLLELAETADIFLTSLRPAALERLSLGVDELRARNPRLIYVRGNGLGFRGEEANRPGYDASVFWARGGFAHVLTPPGQPPIRPRPALGDHAGAMNIAFGMAAALFNREPKALITELASAFKLKSFAEWRSKFHGWDAPWELVQNIKELAADPQAKANDYLFTVRVADGTDVAVVAGPVAFNGSATPGKPLRSPDLGQHSEEVLGRIGVSPERLGELRENNIVR